MVRQQRQRLRFRSTRGVALIAVLWLVSLLTVLAVGTLESVRRHGQLAQRSFEAVRLREIADSAIRVRLLELSEPAAGLPTLPIVGKRSMAVYGIPVALTVELEAGRIDLNDAGVELLTAAFAANEYPADEALSLAQRIIDWRDADDERRPRGAERPEYQREGRRDGPRNAPFEAVSEIRRVLGAGKVTEDLLDAFTVYSHNASVREDSAPRVVARALRWADERQLGGHRWMTDQPPQVIGAAAASLVGEVVRLTACTGVPASHLCREAVVRLTGRPQRPTQVFAWETVAAEVSEEP